MSRDWRFLSDGLRVAARAPGAHGRLAILAFTVTATALLALPSSLGTAPRLVWNASASASLGLYWVGGKSRLERGDLALAKLPESVLRLADQRGYLPTSVPLIKHVAALPGDHICTIGRAMLIGGRIAARRLKRDSKGRLMPVWEGCRLLSADEVFLLNADVPDSFDGRYFGPTRSDEVIGRLVPLWTWPDGQR
jgi:conjugative transfer signal peptidase TraF